MSYDCYNLLSVFKYGISCLKYIYTWNSPDWCRVVKMYRYQLTFYGLKKPKPFIRHIEVSGKMKIKYDGTCSMWIWHYLKALFASISVQHAVRHNQALLYINEHQKCILNEEKHHVSSLQSQLLEVKSHLQKKPDETSLQQYQMEIASLNQKIERVLL